eukprot:CAMPEP_0195587538 /NCGR_PEP_ID=MMETSP0814-20130614/31155_1 /TAXON_ID=97485 /ORGANISM="Prymnesium parvum, Strain Texoma1" /LENGTH=44 /DNA_ID= /DNA_START= /DNA_END= /DNA_ORIENTATION=
MPSLANAKGVSTVVATGSAARVSGRRGRAPGAVAAATTFSPPPS